MSEVGHWRSYKERVAALSQRIVDAQRPIRLLNSIRWGPEVEDAYRKQKWRGLPPVDRAFYEAIDPGFDPAKLAEDFREIQADVGRELGDDEIAKILAETCDEYRQVCR